MNDKTNQENLLPPDDLADVKPAKKKKTKAKKIKMVEVRNTSNKNIRGYNVVYEPGDTFPLTEKAAEMLIEQNRVELVSADSDPT